VPGADYQILTIQHHVSLERPTQHIRKQVYREDSKTLLSIFVMRRMMQIFVAKTNWEDDAKICYRSIFDLYKVYLRTPLCSKKDSCCGVRCCNRSVYRSIPGLHAYIPFHVSVSIQDYSNVCICAYCIEIPNTESRLRRWYSKESTIYFIHKS